MRVKRGFASLGNKDESKPFTTIKHQQRADIAPKGFKTNSMAGRMAPLTLPAIVNIVTAVSRPQNLPRIKRSAELALAKSSLQARWFIIVDGHEGLPPDIENAIQGGRLEVRKVVHTGGSCRFGIAQKNLGMEIAGAGFYHCLDDDNIVHPEFFSGLQRAIEANPGKRAFVFGQQRWDGIQSLVASPLRMRSGQIDNTMFVTHSSLIGRARYDISKAGREDFHFFRKLFDQRREEFVFLPETLAFYNYMQHFPRETPEEKAGESRPSAASGIVLDREPRIPGVMRIALYSSKRERCGISTYTSHLEQSLASMGHDVRHYGSQVPYERVFEEARAWRPDVFHIQHEASIMPPDERLEKEMAGLRHSGTRVVVTLHTANERGLKVGRLVTAGEPGRIITHMRKPEAKDAVFMPMPCTNVGALPDREALRRKFGIPSGAFVVSTVGFMIPWKDHGKIAQTMLPWLQERPDVRLQIIASEHFSEDTKAYSLDCRRQLSELSVRTGGRVHHISNYPSDAEVIERLAASDLGYLWCPFDTWSSSAAAAQFTSARCPLVASDSSHYAFLGTGIVRCKMGSMENFVALVRSTAEDGEQLRILRANQAQMYRQRNYIETARAHIALYEGLS